MLGPSGDVRAGLRVSWLSIGWGAASGSAALGVGGAARSLALVGSGASILIDLSSSVVLVWRFRRHESHPTAERLAHRVAAVALVALALLLAAASAGRLANGGRSHPNGASLVAGASSVVLPLLGTWKLRVAARIPSRALGTDALITFVGAGTSVATVVSVAVAESGIGVGAADPTAALLIAISAGVLGIGELNGRASALACASGSGAQRRKAISPPR